MNSRALYFFHKAVSVLGYIAILYFAVLLIIGQRAHHKKAMDMLSWEKNPGVITSSITTHERRFLARPRHRWCTTLKYSYSRHETVYSAEANECFRREIDVERFSDNYRKGKAIEIYVNPLNPGDSAITLETPNDRKIRYLLCSAIIIMAFLAWKIILEKTAPEKPTNE